MDRDLVGEVLEERYDVLRQIGRGGMGVVYEAEQHLIKRRVAIKVLRREVVQDDSLVKRFLTEATVIAKLGCRHTITLHDFGVSRDGLLYYTMELLDGVPLSQLIEEGPLNPYRAAGLILQACESLKEAHDTGVLHRDLKPDNLFVIDKDGKEEIRVLDFGIAKLMGDKSMESVTGTGMIVGTPRYVSPEQALGNPVGPASDLYSLAVVFYEMLAAAPPFVRITPMKTMLAHIDDPLPKIRQTNPDVDVPVGIEVFLMDALKKDPEQRFGSVSEFRDALVAALKQRGPIPEGVDLAAGSETEQGLKAMTEAWEARPTRLDNKSPEPPPEGERTIRAKPVRTEEESLPAIKQVPLRPHKPGARRRRLTAMLGLVLLIALVQFVWGPWEMPRLGSKKASTPAAVPQEDANVRRDATTQLDGKLQPDVRSDAGMDTAADAKTRQDARGETVTPAAAATGGATRQPETGGRSKTRSEQSDIKDQKVEKLLKQAGEARARKDFDSCITAARKAVRLDSRSTKAKTLLKDCNDKKELGSP